MPRVGLAHLLLAFNSNGASRASIEQQRATVARAPKHRPATLPGNNGNNPPSPAHVSMLPTDASSTQGMGLGDMFRREGDQLKPVLRQLEVPVRAVVLPLADPQASR